VRLDDERIARKTLAHLGLPARLRMAARNHGTVSSSLRARPTATGWTAVGDRLIFHRTDTAHDGGACPFESALPACTCALIRASSPLSFAVAVV